MVFYFFSVGAVLDVRAEVLADRHACCNCQRDSLVSRSKENIEVCSECIIDCFRVVLAELSELGACAVESCVYEKRSLSSGFGYEISKFQYIAINHKLNKFLFILFHFYPPRIWAVSVIGLS